MKDRMPDISTFSSLDTDIMEIFHAHGITVHDYHWENLQDADGEADGRWVIEGSHDMLSSKQIQMYYLYSRLFRAVVETDDELLDRLREIGQAELDEEWAEKLVETLNTMEAYYGEEQDGDNQ